MDKVIKFTVEDTDELCRIDKYLAAVNNDYSRSFIQRLIDDGRVLVNSKPVKASYKIELGDEIEYSVPEASAPEILPEDIPLEVAYEDADIIIVNKPKNMVVHPAAGNYTHTLVNALMYRCGDSLSGINGVLRPGIVHRIDKDTTGLLVICKNDKAHRMIAEQLKDHSVTRRYQAICCGVLKEDEGTIDAPIGRSPSDRKKMAINRVNGKPAITHYKVIKRLKGYTHIECRLETGRTHQIRVHMASLGHPLLGDSTYGGERNGFALEGQCLHAGVLGLIRPSDNTYIETVAELPKYFKDLINRLQ